MQYDCPGRSNPSWLSLMLSTEFQSTLNVQYFITVACPLGILWFKQLKELCFQISIALKIFRIKMILPLERSRKEG